MPRIVKCSVLNCADTTSVRHRFPIKEADVFQIWKERAQHPRFDKITDEHIYKVYMMCGAHFKPEDEIPHSKKLKKRVLPTINIPGLDETLKMIENVASETESSNHDGNYEVPPRVNVTDKSVKRKAGEVNPGSTDGNTSKKPRLSCENDGVLEESVTDNESVDKNPGNASLLTKTDNLQRQEQNPKSKHRQRLSSLYDVGVTRVNHLTPKARKLHEIASRYKKLSAKLKKRNVSFKDRLNMAESAFKDGSLRYLSEKLNNTSLTFFISQVRNQNKQSKGRRYTLDDKILALSLMKQSGRTYRLLRKIFALPSEKSLRVLLQKVDLQPGINASFFAKLKKTGPALNKKDKKCVILWDEMSIEPNLFFNQKLDKIVGFQDYGNSSRNSKFATHALVFMAKGIFKKWKQPIAYMFTGTGDQTQLLRKAIVDVVTAVQDAGFKVIATVCDQGACNQAAINYLLKTRPGKHMSFCIGNDEIFPLFDPPHLLKGIRNNLLTKDLYFELDGGKKTAKWQDIVDLYMMDSGDGEMRILVKLTDRHVLPDKIKKMKVSYAAQVLSQSTSAVMRRFILWDPSSTMGLGTADLCQLMDQTFDSVNGYQLSAPPGKELRCAVRSSTKHIEHWYKAIKVFKSMRYYCIKQKKFVRPPSVKNWTDSLHRLIIIHKDLFKLGYKFVTPRVFNQDALENLFGCIRSHAVRAIKPTPNAFIPSFKSTSINKITSYHSENFNCENDNSDGLLSNLKNLISKDPEPVQTLEITENFEIPLHVPINATKVSKCIQVYVSGWIVKKLKKLISPCTSCMANLETTNPSQDTDFIEAKEYKKGVLTRPNANFNYIVGKCIGITNYLLPKICHRNNLTRILSSYLKKNVPIQIINCKQHKIVDTFLKVITKLLIFHWCKSVNSILCGRNIKFLTSTSVKNKNPGLPVDQIKKAAHNLYLKTKKRQR